MIYIVRGPDLRLTKRVATLIATGVDLVKEGNLLTSRRVRSLLDSGRVVFYGRYMSLNSFEPIIYLCKVRGLSYTVIEVKTRIKHTEKWESAPSALY